VRSLFFLRTLSLFKPKLISPGLNNFRAHDLVPVDPKQRALVPIDSKNQDLVPLFSSRNNYNTGEQQEVVADVIMRYLLYILLLSFLIDDNKKHKKCNGASKPMGYSYSNQSASSSSKSSDPSDDATNNQGVTRCIVN